MGTDIAVVIIGRNEGERLRRCLQSVQSTGMPIVYVDSGSTDGSAELARSMGATVVELDPSRPFSAARGRNEGFACVMEHWPQTRYVQFVDGDCEISPGWLERAARELESRSDVAAVCGRLRERFRDASIYNRLCDLEWNVPAGLSDACGGIAMYRAEFFQAAGGFDASVVAGEEPELCLRLRRRGWKILRVPDEMGWHDAAMTRFRQWWRRMVRSGLSYANGWAMHGRSADRYCLRENLSILFWALVVPLLSLALAWPTNGWSLLLLLAYPLLVLRIFRFQRSREWPAADAMLYACFCVLGKFAQLCGQCLYLARRLTGGHRGPVEYKGPAQAGARAPSSIG